MGACASTPAQGGGLTPAAAPGGLPQTQSDARSEPSASSVLSDGYRGGGGSKVGRHGLVPVDLGIARSGSSVIDRCSLMAKVRAACWKQRNQCQPGRQAGRCAFSLISHSHINARFTAARRNSGHCTAAAQASTRAPAPRRPCPCRCMHYSRTWPCCRQTHCWRFQRRRTC
jgi:hypothetical protein